MKILAVHNFHRKGSASGDDQVFKSETALLESHGNTVIRYSVSNDEFDNAGIDKDTSGLLVIAKNEDAGTSLSRQFFHKTTRRLYTALVWGHVEQDE